MSTKNEVNEELQSKLAKAVEDNEKLEKKLTEAVKENEELQQKLIGLKGILHRVTESERREMNLSSELDKVHNKWVEEKNRSRDLLNQKSATDKKHNISKMRADTKIQK